MSDTKADESSKSKTVDSGISLTRIRTIMRSTADTGPISTEGLFVVAKATKLFVEYLAKGSFKHAKGDTLAYDNLSKMVSEDDKLEFLLPIIPEKITIAKYMEILGKESDGESSEEDDESSEEEESPTKA